MEAREDSTTSPTTSSVATGTDWRDRRQVPIASVVETRPFWWRHPVLVQVVSVAALVWGVGYLVWRIGWSGRGTPLALFLALLAAELFGWLSLGFYVFFGWRIPVTERPPLPDRLPAVDVFVCTYDEAEHVLEATLVGCRAITVPHVTYLLDDGGRPEMETLAHRLGAVYVTRPDNSHAKAGNINHALGSTTGELILFLDADHVPHPDILTATVGYFDDPRLALVQMPHDFFNRDSAQHTRTTRHEQTLFYDVIAPGKDRQGAMFWCGSATVVRRVALEQVGGVLTDTVAEDFHTTIAMHARGWRSRYHNETLVQGLAPHDVAGFLLQRYRWARGNLRVFRTRQNPLTCRGLTPRQRISYFASLLNYFSGLQRFALLLVLMVTLVTGRLPMHASLASLLLLWFPWSALACVSTVALGRGALGSLDSTRYGLMTMGIYVRSVLTLFGAASTTFIVTPKEGVDPGGVRVLRMLSLVTVTGVALFVACVLRVATVLGVMSLPTMPTLATAITVALGLWELVCIVMLLSSLARRRQLRHHFRFLVTLQARIDNTATIVSLCDLTPDGLSFECPVSMDLGLAPRLLTRLPDSTGRLHDVTLTVRVQSSRREVDRPVFRIGCTIVAPDRRTRDRLVEYCFVARLALQAAVDAERLQPALAARHETVQTG